MRGDILCTPVSGHTVVVLNDGAKVNNKPTESTESTKSKEGVCTVEIKQLEKGNKNNTVKALQILLIGYGISCGKWGADGSFGNDTVAAVKAYQKKVFPNDKSKWNGVVDTDTWNKLLGVK